MLVIDSNALDSTTNGDIQQCSHSPLLKYRRCRISCGSELIVMYSRDSSFMQKRAMALRTAIVALVTFDAVRHEELAVRAFRLKLDAVERTVRNGRVLMQSQMDSHCDARDTDS
jgi:hypothetical protein